MHNLPKYRWYLISLGTNLLLKKNARSTNLALIVAYSIAALENPKGPSAKDGMEHNPNDFITNGKEFFIERITCKCLDCVTVKFIDIDKGKSDAANNIKRYITPDACSNCGKKSDEGENDGKLKTCTGCQTAKYCNGACQKVSLCVYVSLLIKKIWSFLTR